MRIVLFLLLISNLKILANRSKLLDSLHKMLYIEIIIVQINNMPMIERGFPMIKKQKILCVLCDFLNTCRHKLTK